jgi:hypothetical protein
LRAAQKVGRPSKAQPVAFLHQVRLAQVYFGRQTSRGPLDFSVAFSPSSRALLLLLLLFN